MSLILFKDKTGKQLFNDLLKEEIQSKHDKLTNQKIMFLNSCEKCIVCGGSAHIDEETQIVQPFLKHHVSYFPQLIAYVHCKCHQKIHDPENPITALIQYEEGDSLRFYKRKKQVSDERRKP